MPEVWVQAPPNFQRVAAQAFQIRRNRFFSAQVLNAPCPGNSAFLKFDKGPPACSPRSPAALHALNSCRNFFASLRLPADVAHNLGSPIHLVETVEMMLRKGFEAQAIGEKSYHGRTRAFRVGPNQ